MMMINISDNSNIINVINVGGGGGPMVFCFGKGSLIDCSK